MTTDFIGDIHGHADAAEAVLHALGYRPSGGAMRCPGRHAVFLGDYVDRGPAQFEAVDLVRRMRDAGSATALMGNHEFNAIAYATRDPADPSTHLRPRRGHNVAQHAAFADAVTLDSPLHRELVAFLLTLPMWAEGPTWRAVHACWDADAMAALEGHLDDGHAFTPEGFLAANVTGSAPYRAAETLCKGPEIDLPPGVSFRDAGGHERTRCRLRWWADAPRLFRDAVAEPALSRVGGLLGNAPYPADARPRDADPRPVLFGHYWLTGLPDLLSPSRGCLDFSVARDGVLCAYSHDGEPALDPARLTWACPEPSPSPGPR